MNILKRSSRREEALILPVDFHVEASLPWSLQNKKGEATRPRRESFA
jgi:hypothetical protein